MDGINEPGARNGNRPVERRRAARLRAVAKTTATVAMITGFVLWTHLGSGIHVFRSEGSSEPGWHQFRAAYGVDEFGQDGNFVRGVKNGYHLIYYTHQYAQRFTRKTAADSVNSCASCHTAEDIAYGFVSSDRFDPKLGKRVSFEERVMRCYAGPMQGYVPTIYDPAVRDIRLFARTVAHHLQLSEGALKHGS